MAVVLFSLSAVAAIAAAALWYADWRIYGAGRRRRWAASHDFRFRRHDDFVADEFAHLGAAASGRGSIKNIVVGHAYGHELVLCDVGPQVLMAVRTGATAALGLDCVRGAAPAGLPVADIAGWQLGSEDVPAAQRVIDERLHHALAAIPAEISQLWWEPEWVCARLDRHSSTETWEQLRAPLALLADVARALPPAQPAPLALGDGDPSRQLPQPAHSLVASAPPAAAVPSSRLGHRSVAHTALPSRVRSDSRGEVDEAAALGSDEHFGDGAVPGEAGSATPPPAAAAVLPRDLSQGSAIFGPPPGPQQRQLPNSPDA